MSSKKTATPTTTPDVATVETQISTLVAEFDNLDAGYLPRYFKLWLLILARRAALGIKKPGKADRATEKTLCGNDHNRYYRGKLVWEFYGGDAVAMQADARGLLEVLEAAKASKAEGKPVKVKTHKRRKPTRPSQKKRAETLRAAVNLLGGVKETLLAMVEVGLTDWNEVFGFASAALNLDGGEEAA